MLSCAAVADEVKKPRVFLLGVDGLSLERLAQVKTPSLDALIQYPAFTGGKLDTRTEQATLSGPGWTTILTGAWADEHGVLNNEVGPAKRPSIFQQLATIGTGTGGDSLELYSLVGWPEIHTRLFPNHTEYVKESYHPSIFADQRNVAKVFEILEKESPYFIFLQLDSPDAAAHRFCFGSVYDKSLRGVDEVVGELKLALDHRETLYGEEWLFILVADHGLRQDGCGHGGQSRLEREIPLMTNVSVPSFETRKNIPQSAIARVILGYLSEE